MAPSRDPFGFSAKNQSSRTGANPLVIVAQPGQEVRIVVSDDADSIGAVGDGRASPKSSGDSRSSPKSSGDSRASPKSSGDVVSQDPFGFRTFRRGFSPSPITIVARPGQEIRIVVPDQTGREPGFSGDSRASPKSGGDQR